MGWDVGPPEKGYVYSRTIGRQGVVGGLIWGSLRGATDMVSEGRRTLYVTRDWGREVRGSETYEEDWRTTRYPRSIRGCRCPGIVQERDTDLMCRGRGKVTVRLNRKSVTESRLQ